MLLSSPRFGVSETDIHMCRWKRLQRIPSLTWIDPYRPGLGVLGAVIDEEGVSRAPAFSPAGVSYTADVSAKMPFTKNFQGLILWRASLF